MQKYPGHASEEQITTQTATLACCIMGSQNIAVNCCLLVCFDAAEDIFRIHLRRLSVVLRCSIVLHCRRAAMSGTARLDLATCLQRALNLETKSLLSRSYHNNSSAECCWATLLHCTSMCEATGGIGTMTFPVHSVSILYRLVTVRPGSSLM